MELGNLVNHRCWIKQPDSGSLLSGWVIDFEKNRLWIEIKESTEHLTPGSKLLFSVRYLQGNAQFIASFVEIDPETAKVVVELESKIAFAESSESTRRLVRETHQLLYQGESMMVEVVDVSRTGIGLRAPIQLRKGEEIVCTLGLDSGELSITGKVIYSTQDGDTMYYRTGLQLSSMNRLNAARWLFFVNADGATPQKSA